MRRRGCRQGIQIIASLKRRDHATSRVSVGNGHQLPRRPGIVILDEAQTSQRVRLMGVETGGDNQQLRLERIQRRQNNLGHLGAKLLAAGAARQGRVDDRSMRPALLTRAGSGIERHLVGRGEHHVRLIPEHRLGPVAVVNVEIHHRDALHPVRGTGMSRRDGDIVEQAEPHRDLGLGVVSRRSPGAEGICGLTGDHRVDGGAYRARRPKRRLSRTRRHRGIRVEARQPDLRLRRENPLDMIPRMHERDLLQRGKRRFPAVKRGERGIVKGPIEGLEAGRSFWVHGAHVVGNTGVVGEKKCHNPLVREASGDQSSTRAVIGTIDRVRPIKPKCQSASKSVEKHQVARIVCDDEYSRGWVLDFHEHTLETLRGLLDDTDISNIEKLRRALRLCANHRAHLVANTLVQSGGLEVRSGPFAGMLVPRRVAEGCFVPKLLGCYEAELHPVIDYIQERRHAHVLNIGCAEGYYAIGLARLLPESQIWAYDTDQRAQEACAALATENGVRDRITLSGTFTHEDFNSFPAGDTMVLCDIEGAENDLLDPDLAPALARFDIQVELHHRFDTPRNQELINRFRETHEIREILPSVRDIEAYPEIRDLEHLDQLLAFWEFRRGPNPWLFMTARDP